MTERLHFHFSLSYIGEGNGNPLKCSCLENPRAGGAWCLWGRTESDTTDLAAVEAAAAAEPSSQHQWLARDPSLVSHPVSHYDHNDWFINGHVIQAVQ